MKKVRLFIGVSLVALFLLCSNDNEYENAELINKNDRIDRDLVISYDDDKRSMLRSGEKSTFIPHNSTAYSFTFD